MIWVLSILGVALSVVIAAALYGWPKPELDAARARAAYEADHFLDKVEAAWMDGRRQVALLLLAGDEALGLVRVLGDRTVTRRLVPGVVKAVEESPQELVIRLDDLVLPKLRFVLDGAEGEDEAAARIRARLADLAASAGRAGGPAARAA